MLKKILILLAALSITACHCSYTACKHNSSGLVKFENIKGVTPLHVASACGNKNIVDFLLKNEANVYARDDEGMTALHYGAISGSIDVVNSLMLADSDVKALNVREETPLMLFKVPESQADIDKVRPARDIIARNRVAIELALKPAFDTEAKSGRG